MFLLIILSYLGINGYEIKQDLFEPVIKVDSIHFPTVDKYLFLKNKSRGLNYTIKVISTSSKKDPIPDISNDLIYKSDLDIFYKVNADTLKVYTRIRSEVPVNFPNEIVLEQKVLDNPTYMNLYDTHEELGLQYF